MLTKNNSKKFFFMFLTTHLFVWTLIPSLSNLNLPLDTIEALAWGSDLKWGFNKHPPFSAFAVEVFYRLFSNQDWAYYLLSQIFIITAFFVIFKLGYEFFKNYHFAFLSVILLEGIFFYNYTSPEFNVNISQIPFWALSIYFSWRCLKYDKFFDYIFLGLFVSFGILSKYIFLYLAIGIKLMFIYFIYKKKKLKLFNLFTAFLIGLLVLTPHILWLIDNNYITLHYGFQRASGSENFLDHIFLPLIFVFKQAGILIPFLILLFFLVDRPKIKKIKIDEKKVFIFFTFITPIFLVILTSFIMGAKIRTMWMTPFYLLIGLSIIEIYKNNIILKKLKTFYFVFIALFLLSPLTYVTVSLSNDFKRTDYPGKEIARLVQNKWDDNFRNEIKVVIGDEWYAGNLSYHLPSRPKWIIDLKNKTSLLKSDQGVIYTGNPKILKKICPGVFGTIKPVGYCMIGIK